MTFSFSGRTIAYDTIGKGSPLLLVHGWGGSRTSLAQLATLLSHRHTVITVDLPGFGESQTPPPQWGTPEYASVVIALLDHLSIKKIDYFGHSFGGSLGVYIASTSNRIRRLILCNSSYKRRQNRSWPVRVAHRVFPASSPVKRLLYRVFFRSSDLSRYPHVEQNFRNIMKVDLTPNLKKITTPTLILWGAEDTVTPLALAHELHEMISDSELVVIPDTRHGLPLRQPELLVGSINRFLS